MSFHKKHFNEYSKLHINQIHGKFFCFTGWLKPQWVTEQFSLLQHIHILFCLNFVSGIKNVHLNYSSKTLNIFPICLCQTYQTKIFKKILKDL